MDPQDYSDDSDDDDLDYKPPGEVEHLSEDDSDDSIEDDEDIATMSTSKWKKNTKKRTKGKSGVQKKSKKMEINDETVEKSQEEVDSLLNSSEDDKKRLDALWEEFQRPITKKSTSKTTNISENKSKQQESVKVSDKPKNTPIRNFEELFNRSDSSAKLENDDNATKPSSEIPTSLMATPTIKKQPGGLANILSQMGKKSKLTILEKSKQDWDGYKKEEGIVEELITHNKGKNGYLEKQDFLERADLRQFELEKAMRAANRSQRN